MTNDLALAVQLLRSSKVVLFGVDEVACLKVGDGHRNSESGVLLESVAVLGDLELGGWHVVG